MSEVNKIDIEKLQNKLDRIQQLSKLCEALRTIITAIKFEASEISSRSLAVLQERLQRRLPIQE